MARSLFKGVRNGINSHQAWLNCTVELLINFLRQRGRSIRAGTVEKNENTSTWLTASSSSVMLLASYQRIEAAAACAAATMDALNA